ncbi:MAG: ribonuclease III [Myxococcota bacterium]|nr:ribonuclease III [Myxococcota bacterium]
MSLAFPTAQKLEETLGYTFRDPALLAQALTHSTYANEHPDEGPPNERLEFLGDAVINLLAGRLLFLRLADESEGELTRRRAQVVRREALADMAQGLELPSHLRLGHGQKSTGGVTTRVLADAFEALAAAVYLDGGYDAVEKIFSRLLADAIDQAVGPVDFKTQLQEECHKVGKPAPIYEVVQVSGPDHAREYSCRVLIDGACYGSGRASSKKVAEQSCAEEALNALKGAGT